VTRLTKKLAVPHGVAFLYDPTMLIVDVPEDTSAGPILHTDSCITIWTVGEYEGKALLTSCDETPDSCWDAVFDGILATEGRTVALLDSGCNPILELAVPENRTRVRIFTNDGSYPETVTCHVEPA
jgi:hypothetical protein